MLSTCNRTEVYATVKDIEQGISVLEEFMASSSGLEIDELRPYLYQPNCYEAIGHLFRVAAGLDSMVLGETQILGQVKDAYNHAIEMGASDGILNTLFQKALHAGKRVRTETGLDRHAVSVSYVAVELARNIFGILEDKTVLVIGAGEMSELTARYLVDNGVSTVMVSTVPMSGPFPWRSASMVLLLVSRTSRDGSPGQILLLAARLPPIMSSGMKR